jgi:hypothetical protein
MSDFGPPPPAPGAQPGDAPGFGPPPPAGFGPPQPGPQAGPQPGWAPPPGPGNPYGVHPATLAADAGTGRPGLAVVAGTGAMLVSAAVYAGVIDVTKHEIGYLALAVGVLIGLALGRIGGRHPALPVVGVVLALVGIFLGEMSGIALLLHKQDGVAYGTILSHLNDLFSAWKASSDAESVFFFVIGGLEAFVFTRRFAGTANNPYRFKRR